MTSTAQSYTLLAPLPCIAGQGVTCEVGTTGTVQPSLSFAQYVPFMFNLLIAFAAVLAVFMIVWGGLEYMTTVSVSGKASGLDRVKNAVYGLLLILCSFLLLRTINPQLVNIPSTIVPKITVNETSSNLTASNDEASYFQSLQNLPTDATNPNDPNVVLNQSTVNQLAAQQAQAVTLSQQLQQQQSQLATLQQQGLSSTDPQVTAAQAQIQNTQNQLDQINANAALTYSLADMNHNMNAVQNSAPTLNSLDEAETTLIEGYKQATTNLAGINNSEQQQEQLDATFYQDQASLIIQKGTVNGNQLGSDDETTLNEDIEALSSSNPSEAASLSAKASQVEGTGTGNTASNSLTPTLFNIIYHAVTP